MTTSINTKEIYKQKIGTHLDLAREKSVELKTKIRSLSDLECLKAIDEVKQREEMVRR